MHFLLISLLTLFFSPTVQWETDFQKAKTDARQQHKLILLNFSGSDWCGPCIRMHKEIFDTEAFETFASGNLVLLKADFPRLKKNKLSKEQQSKNDLLAETYNRNGAFPLTHLLDADGKLLYTWDGLPKLTPEEFIKQIKPFTDVNR